MWLRQITSTTLTSCAHVSSSFYFDEVNAIYVHPAVMAVAISHDFRSLSRQPPTDPDIQSTLSDFLTYTEHFPSHLTRALTLIEDQRTYAEGKIKNVHDDTTSYSILPTI